MENWYTKVGKPVPEDLDNVRSVTFAIKLDSLRPEWGLSPAVITDILKINGLIRVHTIACLSWSCAGTVCITVKSGDKDDKERMDALQGMQCVHACVQDSVILRVTDVFHTGHDSHADAVYLHRAELDSVTQQKYPDITLAAARDAFTPVGEHYVIPKDTPVGRQLADVWKGDPDLEPSFILEANQPNEGLQGATGKAYMRQLMADLKSTVKPFDLSRLVVKAQSKSPGWELCIKLLIVYKVAT